MSSLDENYNIKINTVAIKSHMKESPNSFLVTIENMAK